VFSAADANALVSAVGYVNLSVFSLFTVKREAATSDNAAVAYPGILSGGGGVQPVQLRTEDRENGDLGVVAPLVRGSGGSCDLVQEISFHIVKLS